MPRGTRWALCRVLLLGSMAAAQDKSAIDKSAIRRGALIAISEVNTQGGLLGGRKLELPKVRDALEHLEPHQGLLRTYRPAFTASDHEALELADYKLTTFSPEGVLIPVQP